MANKSVIGNVVLGLGVIGLGALVIAERGISGARTDPVAAASPAQVAELPVTAAPPAAIGGVGVTADSRDAGVSSVSRGETPPGTGTGTGTTAGDAPRVAPGVAAAATPSPVPGTPVAGQVVPVPVPVPDVARPPAVARPASAPRAGSDPDLATDEEMSCDAPSEPAATAVAAGARPAAVSSVPAGAARALLEKLPAARVVRHVVKPGDTLLGLARANKVSIGLIRRLNGLRDDMIRAGKPLAIPQGPFRAAIDRESFALSIFMDDSLVQKYAIGVGRAGSTPTGEFEVRSRVEDPEWTSPEGEFFKSADPLNPLGSRWIGLGDGGYGIHGTTDPTSIGREASRGCIRLNND